MKKIAKAAFAALTAMAMSFQASAYDVDPDYMYTPEKVKLDANGECLVEVHLNTAEVEYNAMEMNIYLPQGFYIVKNARGKYDVKFNTPDVVYDHTAAFAEKDDYVRMVAFSLSSTFILPGDNLLFTIHIKTDTPISDPVEGHIQDIKIASGVTPETAQSHVMQPLYFTVEPYSGTDGVENITMPEDDCEETIYNLQGIKVHRPLQPGIYIINGKKTAVK